MADKNFQQQTQDILERKSTTSWPDFKGAEAEAFDTLKTEFKNRFGLSLWNDVSKLKQSQLDAIKNAAKSGEGPKNREAWNRVIATIQEITANMATIQNFMEGQKVFLLGVQTAIYNKAQQTVIHVGFKKKDPAPSQLFPLSALLDIALDPRSVAAVPYGIGSAGASLIKGIVAFVRDSNPQRDGSKAAHKDQKLNDFTLASLEFEKQLADKFDGFLDATSMVVQKTAADYGKMRDFAKLLNDSKVVWPGKQSALTQEGMAAIEIELWKFFLPARWPITKITNPEDENMTNLIAKSEEEAKIWGKAQMIIWPQSYWVVTGQQWGSRYGHLIHWEYNVWTLADPDKDGLRCKARLQDVAANRLFNVLKVPRADVFEQKNGWSGFKEAEVLWQEGHKGKEVLGS